MARLSPYLRFNGNCRQAMEFYKACLGGELKVMTVGESATQSPMPANMKDLVMHSSLEKEGMVIMASDNPGGEKLTKGNIISLSITSTNKKEIEGYFSKLSEGGKMSHPLEQTFFGWYGDFTDKFGIDWMIQADKG